MKCEVRLFDWIKMFHFPELKTQDNHRDLIQPWPPFVPYERIKQLCNYSE